MSFLRGSLTVMKVLKVLLTVIFIGLTTLLIKSALAEYSQLKNECYQIKKHCEKCCGYKPEEFKLYQCMLYRKAYEDMSRIK